MEGDCEVSGGADRVKWLSWQARGICSMGNTRIDKRGSCTGWFAACACLAFLGPASRAEAHDLTPSMGRPATERRAFQGDPFVIAGCPESISPLAKKTKSSHEESYYVGGGSRERSHHAEERHPHEGIYGVDYKGLLIPKKNALGWWHGRRYQGGTGSYAPDGPRLVHRP